MKKGQKATLNGYNEIAFSVIGGPIIKVKSDELSGRIQMAVVDTLGNMDFMFMGSQVY